MSAFCLCMAKEVCCIVRSIVGVLRGPLWSVNCAIREPARIALRIEPQPERVAIVIADGALGLPGRERAERPQLGEDGRYRRTAVPTVRPRSESSRALNDSHCLPAAAM